MPKNKTKVSNSCFSQLFSFKNLWPLLSLDKHGWVKQEKETQFLQHYSKIDEDFIGCQRDLYKGCERTWVIRSCEWRSRNWQYRAVRKDLGAKKNVRVLEGKANVGNQVQTGSLKRMISLEMARMSSLIQRKTWNETGCFKDQKQCKKWPEHLVRSEKMWLQR